ncbi:MAG: DUF1579 family protein [Anaerolineaceae bacterium]|nr:DUF1579 family protein [Anaerolineaceae bacterium]
MAVPPAIASLVGRWQGTNRLWLDPSEPASESAATAVLDLTAEGKIATLEYTWAYDDEDQQGFLMISQIKEKAVAAWADCWHNHDGIMQMKGAAEESGELWVKGAYSAPPGPDWGWRLALHPDATDQFRLIMHNISPDGEEMLAVEAVFSRA